MSKRPKRHKKKPLNKMVCTLCRRQAKNLHLGIFVPNARLQEAFGGTKTRPAVAPYLLCSACLAMPDSTRMVEQHLLGTTSHQPAEGFALH
jgi:hypothetical protein